MNYWFDQEKEIISTKKYRIEIDLLDNGDISRFSTISPEKMFYEADCGKELDAESFEFHNIGNVIYLVFNQRGNFQVTILPPFLIAIKIQLD